MYRLTATIPNDGPESLIPEVSFHPDGSLLAITYRDINEIRLLDANTMELRRTYRNPDANLDMPHAILMTPRHLIAASRYQLDRPSTLTVYRLEDLGSAPVFTFDTPVDHLREAHSMDIRDDTLLVTYCRNAMGMGGLLSYHFDDGSGEIRGPVDAVQGVFDKLGEPKGVAFTPDGRQALVSVNAEKTPRGWEKLQVDLFKARNVVAKSGLRGLVSKLRGGRHPLYLSDEHLHNGIAVFDVDEQGRLSGEPVRLILREQSCRIENISFNGNTVVLSDTGNNCVQLHDYDADPDMTSPTCTLSQGLAQPHGAKLSPDGRLLVVTNFGLRTHRGVIHWEHHSSPRADNITVFEREPA